MICRFLRQVFGGFLWLILLPIFIYICLDDSVSETIKRQTIFDKDYE